MITLRTLGLAVLVLLTSCAGPEGLAGPAGPASETGPAGDNGDDGSQGIEGQVGDAGQSYAQTVADLVNLFQPYEPAILNVVCDKSGALVRGMCVKDSATTHVRTAAIRRWTWPSDCSSNSAHAYAYR